MTMNDTTPIAADRADTDTRIAQTVTIVAAFVGNPNFRGDASEIGALLGATHGALVALGAGHDVAAPATPPVFEPAVTVRKSIASEDHILSMIDGKPYKALKRHLTGHGLTPAEYRARFGLPASYPMVAPSYSAARRDMAKKIGLGRKPGARAQAA